MIFWKRPHGLEQFHSHSDEALCREVVKGNHEAFLVLFDRYWQDVFRLAYSVLRNEAEAEDLVQGLFLEVHTTMVRHESPVYGLSLEEGTRLIEQGLEQLDDKQRAAVTAYFFRGLSLNEIAHELGESFGNARHHLYRGLERMRRVLARKDEADETSEPDRSVIVRMHGRLTKRVDPEVSVVR